MQKSFPGQWRKPPTQPDFDRFSQRVEELRQSLRLREPELLAAHTGAELVQLDSGEREFQLALWGRPIRVTHPAFKAYPGNGEEELPSFNLAMLLYYFSTADGSPLEDSWIAFSELPDGRFYNQAFQGYTGQELGRSFANDLPAFRQAALKLGGAPQAFGDASFSFLALPHVPILAAYWLGDEDFPASCQILFDASAAHYLPTDAYAILGSSLTSRLIKARK